MRGTPKFTDAVTVAVVFFAWALLYLIGYPRPHVDDLFFTGAGVSIAQGNGLKNPWLGPFLAQFGTDKYYVQTAFHPYLLGIWLKLFGIRASSVLAFQCLAAAIGSASLLLLLRRIGFSSSMLLVSWVLYAAFVLSAGLRPEVLGLACVTTAGLAWSSDRRGLGFLGCFLAACAPLFTPFLYTVVIPMGLAWLLGMFPAGRIGPGTQKRLLVAVGAAMLAFGLMLWSVHFELTDYLRVMGLHAAGRVPPLADKLSVFWANYTVGYEVLFRTPAMILPWLFLCFFFICSESDSGRSKVVRFTGGLALFAALGILGYTQQAVKYLPTVSMLVAGALAVCAAGKQMRNWLSRMWIAAAVILLFPWVAHQVFQLAAFKQYPKEQIERVRLSIASSGNQLYLDEFAVRYFYNFNPPIGSLDWLHCRRQDAMHGSLLKEKPEDASWLVNVRKAHLYAPDAGASPQPLQLFGRSFANFSRNQFEMLYFP